MDISNLKPAESSFMPLRHPSTRQILKDEKGNEVGMLLGSMYCAAWRNRMNRMANSRINNRTKSTAEQSFEEAGDLFAAVTFEVRGLEIEGEKITPKNIAGIYNNPDHGWIRKQVDDWIGDDANFFGSAASE